MGWTQKDSNEASAFMFRDLSDEKEKEFRQWAKDNPKEQPNALYHPVVNDELRKIHSPSDES